MTRRTPLRPAALGALLLGLASVPCPAGRPAPASAPRLTLTLRYLEGSGPSIFKDRLTRELGEALDRSGCVRLARPGAAEAEPAFTLEVLIRRVGEEVEYDRTLAEQASGDPEARPHPTARVDAAIEARLVQQQTPLRVKAFEARAAYTAVQTEDPREEAHRELISSLVHRLRSWTCKGVARAER